jgi:membrane protein
MASRDAAEREAPVPPQPGDGEEPTSPADLGKRDWRDTLRRTLREFKEDRAGMAAAALAYYWFLSIFPALIAAVGFFGLLQVSPDFIATITDGIRTLIPGDAAELLTGAIRGAQRHPQEASLVAALLGLAVALWSASSGMVAVQEALDVAYDVPESRKFLSKRATALVLVLGTGVLGGAASALLVFGDPIGELIRDAFPVGDLFLVLWNVIRWVGPLLALTTLFALFYFLAPNRPSPNWKWVSPGGLLATAIWVLASLGFSFYVSSFGSYGRTYGSLAGTVVLVIWLYLTGLAVVLGGELNAEIERQGQIKRERSS